MNKSIVANSEICQYCAKCCKVYYEFTESYDFALRMVLLDHQDISVREFNLPNGNKVWRITFNKVCKELNKDKNGKYYCKIWDKERPEFCRTYPDNMPISYFDAIKDTCPALKRWMKDVGE